MHQKRKLSPKSEMMKNKLNSTIDKLKLDNSRDFSIQEKKKKYLTPNARSSEKNHTQPNINNNNNTISISNQQNSNAELLSSVLDASKQ